MVLGCVFMASPAVRLSAAPPSRFQQSAQIAVADHAAQQPLFLHGRNTQLLRPTSRRSRPVIAVDGETAGTASPECIRSRTLAAACPACRRGADPQNPPRESPCAGSRRLPARPQRQHRRGRRGWRQFMPQASRFTPQSRAMSLACARVEPKLQVKLISASPLRFSVASRRRISSVSPLARQRKSPHRRASARQVAVYRLGGMQKQCRAAGGTERGRNLLRNDAALAHAGHHNSAVLMSAAHDQPHSAGERLGHRPSRRAGQGFQRRRPRCEPSPRDQAPPAPGSRLLSRYLQNRSSLFDGISSAAFLACDRKPLLSTFHTCYYKSACATTIELKRSRSP